MANTNIMTGYTYTSVIVFCMCCLGLNCPVVFLKPWLSQCSYVISYYQWIKCQVSVNVATATLNQKTSSHIIQSRLKEVSREAKKKQHAKAE